MTKLALIGKDISHSKSQQIYEGLLKRKVDYDLLDYQSADLIPPAKKLLEKYEGVSITAPYKKHFLNEVKMAEEIKEINAINCLYVENSKIYGTNTDYLAVDSIIDEYIAKLGEFNIYILGDGSMSSITQRVLKQKGCNFLVFSRKLTESFSALDFSKIEGKREQTLVINTCARVYEYNKDFKENTYFWDHNYNFLPHAKSIPAKVVEYKDGMSLLERQGLHALKFWKIT